MSSTIQSAWGKLRAVQALAKDKPKILFYGAMMAIQNFGFFVMYYQVYPTIPLSNSAIGMDCDNLRFWVGFFALDCFVESFGCLWMAMGGYTEDKFWFPFGWFFHLFVALPYCVCTVGIPVAMYEDKGKVCRQAMGSMAHPLEAIYWTHAALFLVYVWMMLSITYYSWAKATIFKKGEVGVE